MQERILISLFPESSVIVPGIDRSKLSAEYIVMEKVRGVELGRVWEGLKGGEKLSVVRHVASKLARTSFPLYGSLYLREDVGGREHQDR